MKAEKEEREKHMIYVMSDIHGEYDKFKEDCADFNEDNIFYADYDGTTDKGNTAAAAVFTANPQITTWMVMGANEEGTIGACRALETAGLDANACVVGLGAYMAKMSGMTKVLTEHA